MQDDLEFTRPCCEVSSTGLIHHWCEVNPSLKWLHTINQFLYKCHDQHHRSQSVHTKLHVELNFDEQQCEFATDQIANHLDSVDLGEKQNFKKSKMGPLYLYIKLLPPKKLYNRIMHYSFLQWYETVCTSGLLSGHGLLALISVMKMMMADCDVPKTVQEVL